MAQMQSSDVPSASLVEQRIEQSHFRWWITKISDIGNAEYERISNASPAERIGRVIPLDFLEYAFFSQHTTSKDIEKQYAHNKMAGAFKQDKIVLAAFSRVQDALSHLSDLLDIIARLNSAFEGESSSGCGTGSTEIKLCHLESTIDDALDNCFGALTDLHSARTDTEFPGDVHAGFLHTTGTLACRFIGTMPRDWSESTFFVREDAEYLWQNHVRLRDITRDSANTAEDEANCMRQVAEDVWRIIHTNDEWARVYLDG
ncbi:MAG: hypothetical protein Q9194_005370 [Teloschistes cf. exilis]